MQRRRAPELALFTPSMLRKRIALMACSTSGSVDVDPALVGVSTVAVALTRSAVPRCARSATGRPAARPLMSGAGRPQGRTPAPCIASVWLIVLAMAAAGVERGSQDARL